MRIDPALAVSLALALGATGVTTPVCTAVAAACALCSGFLHLERRWWWAVVIALAVGYGRGAIALSAHEAARKHARSLLPQPRRCALTGVVVSSPCRRQGTMSFLALTDALDCEGQPMVGPFYARLYGGPERLARGDRFQAIADLAPVRSFNNFDLADARPGDTRREAVVSGSLLTLSIEDGGRELRTLIDRARASVRRRIDATYPPATQALARALVLGESDLEREDNDAFQKSGLSHLLAVSGTHLVVAVLALVRALTAILRRVDTLATRGDVARPAALLGLVLAPLYADFAGGSGSAWRAAWMLVAVLGARAMGRYAPTSRIVAFSLLVGWAGDGLVVFDTSFVLSLAATVGLLSIGRRLSRDARYSAGDLLVSQRPSWVRVIAVVGNTSLTTLAATFACVPIMLTLSPGLTLAGVAGNLLAAPVGEAIALPLCLLHTLTWRFPLLEQGTALTASAALGVVKTTAHLTASVPWLYVELPPPTPWHMGTVAALAAALVAVHGQPWIGSAQGAGDASQSTAYWLTALSCVAWLGALAAVEVGVKSRHAAATSQALGRLRITALDVGQGDATLVDLPDGRLMLIDGGGLVGSPIDTGQRVILPTLRARRRSHIDIVVLSHPHPDHFGGLLSVAKTVSIGEFWYTGQGEAEGAGASYAALLRILRRNGVKLRNAAQLCAAARDARVEVLAPCPSFDETRHANDNSLVLRISAGPYAALLTGDAERWAEQRLTQLPLNRLDANYLKVGHHGSRTSTSPDFLARVSPDLSTISCGVRNRFGHPHSVTVRTLTQQGTVVARLDRYGAVEWQTDGVTQHYRSVLSPPRADAFVDLAGYTRGDVRGP